MSPARADRPERSPRIRVRRQDDRGVLPTGSGCYTVDWRPLDAARFVEVAQSGGIARAAAGCTTLRGAHAENWETWIVADAAGQIVGQSGQFPSTHWSGIDRAREEGVTGARPALTELLRRYQPALRSYLILGRRIDPHDADDLLQGFISSEILERELVKHAEQERGRFRGLLLTALQRYVIRDRRSRNARKRAPERGVSLEELPAPAVPAAPGQGQCDTFDVAWARQVIEQALQGMRQECESSRRPDVWAVFEGRILAPTLDGAQPLPYEQLVRQFGLQTPRQASNTVITAKRMFVRHLEAVIGQYADPDEIKAEIDDLTRILSRSGAAGAEAR